MREIILSVILLAMILFTHYGLKYMERNDSPDTQK